MRELPWNEVLDLIRGRAIRAIDIPKDGVIFVIRNRFYKLQFDSEGVLHAWEWL